MFSGDATKYQQVLINLLANAVKFSPTHGKIRVKISNSSVQDGVSFEGQKTLLSVIV